MTMVSTLGIMGIHLATMGTRIIPFMALQIHFKPITRGFLIPFEVMSFAAPRPPFCLLKEDLILTACRLRVLYLSNLKQVPVMVVP